MADITEGGSGFDIKFHDNGDGTYSPYVTVLSNTGQSSAPLINGQLTVGTSIVSLPSHALTQGVTIQALTTNSVSVFVGTSTVTTSGATGGIELPPGSAVTIAVSNTNTISCISSSSSQLISFIGS